MRPKIKNNLRPFNIKMSDTDETWKTISVCEHYEISNFGEVRDKRKMGYLKMDSRGSINLYNKCERKKFYPLKHAKKVFGDKFDKTLPETWTPVNINGYEYYHISNHGNVINTRAPLVNVYKNRVTLRDDDGNKSNVSVPHIFSEAFGIGESNDELKCRMTTMLMMSELYKTIE